MCTASFNLQNESMRQILLSLFYKKEDFMVITMLIVLQTVWEWLNYCFLYLYVNSYTKNAEKVVNVIEDFIQKTFFDFKYILWCIFKPRL